MLKDSKAFSGFSVDDLEKAKKFYSETLGVEVTEELMGDEFKTLKLHIAGSNSIFVYPKDDHVPATFTILNFPVKNIDEAVEELKKRGVQFESYDSGFLKTDDKNIARNEGQSSAIAWFKDPAGNFLSLIEDKE